MRNVLVVLVLGAALCVAAACNGATDEQVPLGFLQYFDPECPVCAEMEPIVERLESDYADRLESFEILDITTDEGRQRVEEAGVFLTPTFVLLDEDGEELDRITGATTEENLVDFVERGIADVTGE